RVLIERFLGLPDLASYHLAYALASLPILMTDAVQAAWLPHFYGLAPAEKRELTGRLAPAVTRTVVAVAAAVVLLAPAAGRALAPPDFDFPITVVALVVSVTFVRASYLLAFAVVSDKKESGSIARASALGALANIGLNLWLIPVWGLTGAAVSTLLGYTLMSIALARRAERVSGRSLDLASLSRLWFVGAGFMLVLAAVPAAVPAGPPGWVARVLLAIPVAASVWVSARRLREEYATVVTRETVTPPVSPAHRP
ncbi:MAG: polysaccharide biosynthesis C-terminal domain-containing protein, partial [Actinomycetota bacterium]